MANRTYTQKDGTIWEWEETPELLTLLGLTNESPQLATPLKEKPKAPPKTTGA